MGSNPIAPTFYKEFIMPYIDKLEREELDHHITYLVEAIKNTSDPNDFKNHLGRINYVFSRVLSGVMGEINYAKIAMATGVIENIKQEFYRRVASAYENKKIADNGDIKEYE